MNDSDKAAKQAEWLRIPDRIEMAKELMRARRPGWALMRTMTPDAPGADGCWFGGEPTLPPEIEWPTWSLAGVHDNIPLHFLAQINLQQVPSSDELPALPKTGTLFFFYDPAVAPANDMESGGVKTIYVESDVSLCPTRPMPEMPKFESIDYLTWWYADKPTSGYKRWNFDFMAYEGISTYGNGHPNRIIGNRLLEESVDSRAEFANQTIGQRPKGFEPDEYFTPHQMFSSNGSLEPKGDMVRLLAIRSEPEWHFDHGGNWIVFWIGENDLAEQRFDKIVAWEELR